MSVTSYHAKRIIGEYSGAQVDKYIARCSACDVEVAMYFPVDSKKWRARDLTRYALIAYCPHAYVPAKAYSRRSK